MLKFSKKIEYGILAMDFIASKDENVSAKEISNSLDIPFEFLSKTLQKLMKEGLIESRQGIRGGYKLAKNPCDISVLDIIIALDENPNIIECYGNNIYSKCQNIKVCSIKYPMQKLQDEINNLFDKLTIEEMSKYKNVNEAYMR